MALKNKQKKKNSKKTVKQQKNKYKILQYSLFGGEFISIILPFVAIGIVKYEDYFVEYDGVKMSIAAILALALMGIAVALVSAKKFENSFIALIVGWFATAFIFFLMGQVINDIASIMFIGGIGILGAFGLDMGSKKAEQKANAIQNAMKEAETEITKEQYKKELLEKENETKEENKGVRF